MKFFIKSHLKSLSILSVIAGVFYNSWVLGHWLNLNVSKNSLASGLEAVGQPFNWVFISGDILSSLLMIMICLWLLQTNKETGAYKSVNLAIVCLILFGVGTIIDALLPLKCVQGIQACPSFTNDHLLLVHGVFSILASAFLFMGLLILWFHLKRNIIIDILLSGYALFGIISLVEAIVPGKNGNWSQDYYITLCSVWIALIPYIIYQFLNY